LFVGFLSNPVTTYPALFGNLGSLTDFLLIYPYFLPCFISASICGVGFIFGVLFLEETLGGVQLQEKKQQQEERQRLLDQTDEDGYNTFDQGNNEEDRSIKKVDPPPTLKEALTPTVWAISISYAIYAYQVVYYDGKAGTEEHQKKKKKKKKSHRITYPFSFSVWYRTIPHLDSKQTLVWWSRLCIQ
jgi:hypothetical protein